MYSVQAVTCTAQETQDVCLAVQECLSLLSSAYVGAAGLAATALEALVLECVESVRQWGGEGEAGCEEEGAVGCCCTQTTFRGSRDLTSGTYIGRDWCTARVWCDWTRLSLSATSSTGAPKSASSSRPLCQHCVPIGPRPVLLCPHSGSWR